jgi:ADP-ribose pyrophosphatase YjhB (NUDIX family)
VVSIDKILNKIGNNYLCPVVAIIRRNKILIGLRNYTADKWKEISVWTLPGGRYDEGEAIETTLRREVAEEVGIRDLAISQFLGIVPGAKEGDQVYIFKATTSREPILMEPEKFSEWRWVPLSKIPENFINEAALKLIKKKTKKAIDK